jgi:hypothetical protein
VEGGGSSFEKTHQCRIIVVFFFIFSGHPAKEQLEKYAMELESQSATAMR